MLNVFIEQKANKKNCPNITYHDREDISNLINWDKNLKQITNYSKTIVVVGYWRVLKIGVKPHYERYYMLNTKADDEFIFLQKQPENNYDLLIGIKPDPLNQLTKNNILGGIKIDGNLKEECIDDSKVSNGIRYKIAEQLAFTPASGKKWCGVDFLKIFSINQQEKDTW